MLRIKKRSTEFSAISLVKELARKSIHITSCLIALWLVQNDYIILELLFLPTIALGFYISEKVELLGKTLSFGNRRKWGGILLAVGLSLVMLAPVDYEVKKFAILILMIADVLASIIGKIVPIRKVEVLGAYKSIGGSTAFLIGTLIALELAFELSGVAIWKMVTTIVLLEICEFFNWRGIDNVTLPLASLLLGAYLL